MNKLKNTTRAQLRGAIIAQGMSLPKIAEQEGLNKATVMTIARRYCGQDVKPRGDVTKSIINILWAYYKKFKRSKCNG